MRKRFREAMKLEPTGSTERTDAYTCQSETRVIVAMVRDERIEVIVCEREGRLTDDKFRDMDKAVEYINDYITESKEQGYDMEWVLAQEQEVENV